MRNQETGRTALQDVFAERQVHIRSGAQSQYVVLSRPLQIGVAAGCLGVVALLAVVSYAAITRQFTVAGQEDNLAELASQIADADRRSLQLEAEVERLNTALDAAQDDQAVALAASETLNERTASLEAALVAADEAKEALVEDVAQARAAGQAQSASMTAREQAALAEVTGLRAELERLNREVETLRGLSPTTQVTAEPTAGQLRQLQQDIANAQAATANLIADTGTSTANGANPTGDAAADLAALKGHLDTANQRIEELGITMVAQESDDVVTEALSPAAPLPSPPAPR
ncbi:MAG: hypothetical protein AAF637_24435 [Pseudomonadota bacterium]